MDQAPKSDSYFYTPIPFYNGEVLKCQGMATEANKGWFMEANKTAVVLNKYMGDRINASDYSEFTGA